MDPLQKTGEKEHEIDTVEYDNLTAMVQKKKLKSDENRFVKFDERKDDGVVSFEMFKVLATGKYLTQWKGVDVMKDALDLVIYQQLLWELKPRTVFEIGAFSGGSALWMADMLKSYGCDAHVFSLDISLRNVHAEAKSCKDITFVEGDVNRIEELFPEKQLQELPHPWFVVEDCHANVVGVLKFFDRFLQPGDYMIVEDTTPNINGRLGEGLLPELEYTEWGPAKLNTLKAFMKDYSDHYVVDQRYADFFGYNGTNNSNAFLKRV